MLARANRLAANLTRTRSLAGSSNIRCAMTPGPQINSSTQRCAVQRSSHSLLSEEACHAPGRAPYLSAARARDVDVAWRRRLASGAMASAATLQAPTITPVRVSESLAS